MIIKSSLVALASCLFGLALFGMDRPHLSPERLAASSSDVVIGAVVRVYTKELTNTDFQTTLCVAEIAVEKVVKGDSLKPGSIVFAKYYSKKWVGEGQMPPGWNGQQCVAGGRYRVHLRGSHVKGFRVVEPNGFAALNYELYVPNDKLDVLNRHFRTLCLDNGNSPFFTKIHGREIKRILVVQHLLSTIANDLKTVDKDDSEKLRTLASEIKDLEILLVGEHGETILQFKQKLGEMSNMAG